MPSGAPSLDRDAILGKVCERLPDFPGGLRKLCRQHSDLPSEETIRLWMREDPVIEARVNAARELQAESLLYQGMDIVDEATPDVASVAKLRSDYRLKMIPKIAPRTMGDRQAVELSGDPDKPLGVGVAAQVELTPEARKAIRKAAREALSESDE